MQSFIVSILLVVSFWFLLSSQSHDTGYVHDSPTPTIHEIPDLVENNPEPEQLELPGSSPPPAPPAVPPPPPSIIDQKKIQELLKKITEPKKELSQDHIYQKGLSSVVNILCYKNKNEIVMATGSIISSDGLILSVAHMADGLNKNNLSCSVRRGSPANSFATAKLVFIPEAYGKAQTDGERAFFDISLWRIEGTSGNFTPLEIDYESLSHENERFLTLSYAAEFLSGEGVLHDLHLLFSSTESVSSESSYIKSRSSLSSQHGSSGGILIDPYTGKIRSMVFGVSNTEQVSERFLFSLTPASINKALLEETGLSLKEYIAEGR